MATITGEVRDTSGALVPGAAVTVINEGTHVESTTNTNSDGSFVVPALTEGTYTVRVSKQGFQTFSETGIILHPTQVSTVNPTMKVGEVSTQVQVAASAVAVQTTSPEISNEVSGTEAETLPLNGRNYQSLAALMPGVTNTNPATSLAATGDSGTNLSINGMSVSGTMYYVDGIWDMNSGSFNAVTVTPNPDTIEEARVLQNNYGVEYNLMGGNVVIVQTKSGTSTFHGNAFEYLRNTSLAARNFFSPSVPVLKQNIFGYTLGGPLFIPNHYNTNRDKTFFFWSQQWTIKHNASVALGADPTAAEREGTFNSPITNPLTGSPFPQSSPGVYQIPSINSNSTALLTALVPLPNNLSGGFLNYVNVLPVINDYRQDLIKVDHMFSERLRLTGEYFDDRGKETLPYGFASGVFANQSAFLGFPEQLAKLQLTQTLAPSMVNTTYIAMNNLEVDLGQTGITDRSQVPGFQEVLPYNGSGSQHLPFISFSQGWPNIGGEPWEPQRAADLEDSLADDWSWLRGKHYVQGGMQWIRGGKRQEPGTPSNGNWSFTGNYTGNALADFLIGDATTLSQSSNSPRAYVHYTIFSPYFQDTWRVAKHLTLTLGLRVEYLPQPYGASGLVAYFDPHLYNLADAPIVNADGTITPTPTYNPANGMVIAGIKGVPRSWQNVHDWDLGPSGGFAWDVFGDGKTSLRGGFGIAYTRIPTETDCSFYCYTNPPLVESETLVQPSFPNPIGAAVAPQGAPGLHAEAYGEHPAGQVQSYSLSLQHQFGNNWFASIAGAGNNANHVATGYNINQPFEDPPYDYNPIINSGTVYTYQYGPYLGYDAIYDLNSASVIHWDALELQVRHPVGRGLFGTIAYTWQNTLGDDTGYNNLFGGGNEAQDAHHPRNMYGVLNYNVSQVLTGDLLWTVPWFSNAKGWKRNVLGGWRFSDITTIQAGFPQDPMLSVANQGLATTPNRIASNLKGPKTVSQWFNTAAFAAPAAGYFGNAGPDSILGPGLIDFDMCLYKDFRFNERNKLEFRGEFFNIFNHTNFSGVQTTFGAGNFGQVTSAYDPRIVEFALRWEF
jgi:hypothetical protein